MAIGESVPTHSQVERSLAEWITFGVASTLLIVLIGLVFYAWFISQNRPPILKVEPVESVRAVEQQYYVPFVVVNAGGSSAEAIQVVAELHIDGEADEMGEQQIDSLSGGETTEGSFVFSHDPLQGELVLRVASYRLPQSAKITSTLPSQKTESSNNSTKVPPTVTPTMPTTLSPSILPTMSPIVLFKLFQTV